MIRSVILWSFLTFLVAMNASQAQVVLVLHQKNGDRSSFSVHDLRSITFPEGMVMLTKTNGDNQAYIIWDVQSINFGRSTGGVSGTWIPGPEPALYPNPVPGEFHLSLQEHPGSEIRIDITDMKGVRVFNKNYVLTGQSPLTIDVSGLSSGIYLCHISGDKLSVFRKFIKY